MIRAKILTLGSLNIEFFFFYFLGYHRTGKILYNNYVNKFFFLIPTILCNIVLCLLCNFVNLFCRNHVRRRICIFQFSQRFCWFYFLKKKPMCFSRPTKDLVYTLHLTIRGSILSTYIFQNHDVIFDDESHFKINKKRKEKNSNSNLQTLSYF